MMASSQKPMFPSPASSSRIDQVQVCDWPSLGRRLILPGNQSLCPGMGVAVWTELVSGPPWEEGGGQPRQPQTMATTVAKDTGSQEGPRAIREKIVKEKSVFIRQAERQRVGRISGSGARGNLGVT